MLTKRELIKKYYKKIRQTIKPFVNDITVVFIAGEQRSGTNMLTKILNQSLETECFLENDDEAFDQYLLKTPSIVDGLVQHSNAKIIVFKSICDSQNIYTLLNRYQPAKCIWAYRHYNDVVNSSLRRFTEHRKYLHYMLYDKKKASWRIENVTKEDYALVEKLYNQGIDDASSRALIWHLRNSQFFQQKLDKSSNAILSKYEDLVTSTEESGDSICKFVGINKIKFDNKLAFSSSIRKNSPPCILPEIEKLCLNTYEKLELVYSQC
jgi:hypothetical protein